MSDSFGQGAPQFGLHRAKLAPLTSFGPSVWESPLTRVFSVEMAQGTAQMVNGIARGDDHITATAAILEGAQLQLRFTGLQPAVVAKMMGKDETTISSVKQVQYIGGEHMPYFGIAICAIAANLTDTWIWFPLAKILENFVFFQGEYGTFNSPTVTLQCVPDDVWGLWNIITHPTHIDITEFPPPNIAQIA